MSCPRPGEECNDYMCGGMIDGFCQEPKNSEKLKKDKQFDEERRMPVRIESDKGEKMISKSEAIKRIKECKNTPNFQPYTYVNEALDMAIDVLSLLEKYENNNVLNFVLKDGKKMTLENQNNNLEAKLWTENQDYMGKINWDVNTISDMLFTVDYDKKN